MNINGFVTLIAVGLIVGVTDGYTGLSCTSSAQVH